MTACVVCGKPARSWECAHVDLGAQTRYGVTCSPECRSARSRQINAGRGCGRTGASLPVLRLIIKLNRSRLRKGHDHPDTQALDFELDRQDFARGYLRRFDRNGNGTEAAPQRNPQWREALAKLRGRRAA